jgi:bacillithiol biosynthesis deacetylase BshB1
MVEETGLDALAIGAHPDDVEFSCAGTLLKLVALGYRVGILDLTRGELGTRGTAEIRTREAETAARALGLVVRDNLELQDGHIWLNEESRVAMVRKLRQYRPRVIFTHFWEDPHPDHVHTCQIVREAAHVAGLAKYDGETRQERFRPHAVAHFMFPRTVSPSFVVDISEFADQKRAAVNSYRSQLHQPDSTEPETKISSAAFLHMLLARQHFYGSLISVEHGEAFVVRETINVRDPVELLSRPMNMYL